MGIKHCEVGALAHASRAYLVVDALIQFLAVLTKFRDVVHEDVFDQDVADDVVGCDFLADRVHGILQLLNVFLVEALDCALELIVLDRGRRNNPTLIILNLQNSLIRLFFAKYLSDQ